LITAPERVNRALDKLTAGKTFTPQQQKWLLYIQLHLVKNLLIDRNDFNETPFSRHGGWKKAKSNNLCRGETAQATSFLHGCEEVFAKRSTDER